MTIEQAEKARELMDEIKEINHYKKILSDKELGELAHVAFVQHYGDLKSYDRVDLSQKYNVLFIPIFDSIISRLSTELAEL